MDIIIIIIIINGYVTNVKTTFITPLLHDPKAVNVE